MSLHANIEQINLRNIEAQQRCQYIYSVERTQFGFKNPLILYLSISLVCLYNHCFLFLSCSIIDGVNKDCKL